LKSTSSNARRPRPGTLVLTLLLAGLQALPLPALAQVRLPALGESASDDLSVSAERRIGEQIMREGRRDPTYLDDAVLLDYLYTLWAPLVAAARERGEIDADTDRAFPFEAFLLSDRSVNAFALPGGYVGVHLGLIAITNTRDQLASVLAHELAHVTQRHIARSIAGTRTSSLVSVAALLLGLLAASRSNNADMANAAITGGQAAAIQGQLNYSRDIEREADRVGYGLLGAAGFATTGMAEMFDRLDVATRLNDNGGFPYLRSHPLTVDRISEARSRSLLGSSLEPGPRLAHALMQMRARVLMDPSTASLQKLAGGGTSSPLRMDQVVAAYGGALAASQLKDHAQAEAHALQALRLAGTLTPAEPQAGLALQLLLAEIRLANANPGGALQALAGSPADLGPRPRLLLSAQAALDQQRLQPATDRAELRRQTEALQTWVAAQPQDAAAWQLLSATSDALGLRLRSLRAGAEAQAARGDLTGAIDRMRAAQSAARTASEGQDFIEASVIDSRMRQLVAERRRLVLEMREASGQRSPRDPNEPPPT
jgi:predicted Zn-dependent protease